MRTRLAFPRISPCQAKSRGEDEFERDYDGRTKTTIGDNEEEISMKSVPGTILQGLTGN